MWSKKEKEKRLKNTIDFLDKSRLSLWEAELMVEDLFNDNRDMRKKLIQKIIRLIHRIKYLSDEIESKAEESLK